MKFSLLFILGVRAAFSMEMVECQKVSTQAERFSEKRSYTQALKLSEQVVKECKVAPDRAVILAGKLNLNYKKDSQKALRYFKQAMKQGPDFYMGFLNASAAYMNMGAFDESISYAKKAIEKAKTDENKAKGKYNLGLAYYKKAAPQNDKAIYKLGYEQFKETSKSAQFKGASHYFMALYEETIPFDEVNARKNYTLACSSGHKQSCISVQGLTDRITPHLLKKNYKPAQNYETLSVDELSEEMKKCYKAKYNMQDSAVDSTVKSIVGSFASMDAKQKKKMVIQTLNSIGCKK
jgi:tetratricopeptide (TPR) repeat protein